MRIGSLCTGIGGLDLGVQSAVGGTVAWHVENDRYPSAVLQTRFPGVPNLGDVKTVDWSQVEPVDWVVAGYPCTPFSNAGLRRGEDDPRHLWPYVADAIRTLRPANILLENVRGHLNRGFGTVLGELATLGYDARWCCVRAGDVGAPHRRERVFIWATPADTGSEVAQERPGLHPGGTTELWRGRPRDGVVEAAAHPDGAGRGEHGRGGAVPTEHGAAERGGDVAADTEPVSHEQLRDPAALAGATGRGGEADRDQARAGVAGGRGDAGDTVGAGRDGTAPGLWWGPYEPAVQRWERLTRPAPRPTEPTGRGGAERLSPRFVEWMMGLPAGWVTGCDIPHIAQLKALGNAVVPQQAALALRTLGAVSPPSSNECGRSAWAA